MTALRSGFSARSRRAASASSSLRILFNVFVYFTISSTASFGQQVTVTARLELFREGSTTARESAGGVVWLTRVGEPVEPPAPPSTSRQQLVQKNKSFTPHLVVVPVGSAVVFPNKDPFFHNVFSLFEGK